MPVSGYVASCRVGVTMISHIVAHSASRLGPVRFSDLTIHQTKTHSSITPACMDSTVSPDLMSCALVFCNDDLLVSTAWPLSGTKHGLLMGSGGWGQPHSPMFSPAQGLSANKTW